MKIAVIGRGRVARTLAPVLSDAGHEITLVGRDLVVPSGVDLYWLLVPDRAIAAVAALLPAGPAIAHASGASGLDLLKPHAVRGSLHPLMTFPGPEIAIPPLGQTPAAIDANTEAFAASLTSLAHAMGMRPFRVPGDRRLYHAAAVIAGNFGTVLLAEAARALSRAGVPENEAASLLAPLAVESLGNAASDPKAALTGPVARGDHAVLDAHRDALTSAGLSDLRDLYDVLVEHAVRLRQS